MVAARTLPGGLARRRMMLCLCWCSVGHSPTGNFRDIDERGYIIYRLLRECVNENNPSY